MNETPKGLHIVRGIEKEQYWDGAPVKSDAPFRMEGIFGSREEAEAFQAELESKAAARGDPGPLLDVGGIEGLMALSAFEPGVFRDYLIDHGIPDPDTYESRRRVSGPTRFHDWLAEMPAEQLAALYAALHHFRFYEIVEVPFVFGDYGADRWEEWEKTLPPYTPLDPEDWGFTDVEGGFRAEPGGGTPPPGYFDDLPPEPWDPAPPGSPGPANPWPPGSDEIPF